MTPEEHREKNLQRRMRTCRHFTGIQHDACAAGVAYESVTDRSLRPPRRPCLDENSPIRCELANYPTREEAEERDREIHEGLLLIFKARAAIVEAMGSKRGLKGQIPCPCCDGGTLHYTVAAINGHIWGACSTPSCVRWME